MAHAPPRSPGSIRTSSRTYQMPPVPRRTTAFTGGSFLPLLPHRLPPGPAGPWRVRANQLVENLLDPLERERAGAGDRLVGRGALREDRALEVSGHVRLSRAPADEEQERADRGGGIVGVIRLDGHAVRGPIRAAERRGARVHRHVAAEGPLVAPGMIGREEAPHVTTSAGRRACVSAPRSPAPARRSP